MNMSCKMAWFFIRRDEPVKIGSSENIKHSVIHVQSILIMFIYFFNSTHTIV